MDTKQLQTEVKSATAHFWRTRQLQATRQEGSGKTDKGARAAVTGGAQMDGFVSLFAQIIFLGRLLVDTLLFRFMLIFA